MNEPIYVGKKYLSWPSWSPNGSQIAFVENGDLIVVDLDGTIMSTNRSVFIQSKPMWSPNGDYVVVAGYGSSVHALGTSSEESLFIAEGWSPKFSKPKDKIWFASGSGLFTTSLKRSPIQQIAVKCRGSDNYDCSPDGTKIVYCDNEYIITIANIDGSDSRHLFRDHGLSRHGLHVHFGNTPRWSPNGRYIAFHQVTDKDRIFVAETDSSDIYIAGHGLSPLWSFNSSRLLFETNDEMIKIADPKGTHEQIISNGRSPSWSPNDVDIAYIEKSHNLVIKRV
jgi:Tol biopolymer transport system component